MRIATACEGFETILHPRVHGAIAIPEAFVVDLKELFGMVLDDVLEGICRWTRSVAWAGIGGARGHEDSRRREAA